MLEEGNLINNLCKFKLCYIYSVAALQVQNSMSYDPKIGEIICDIHTYKLTQN